jgi:hypothetical protein
MNAGVAALTISLLENPTGRRGHWSSSRADQSLWNESDTITMPPRFATTFDSKLVAVGGAMGASRCQGFGRFVGVGARCQALFLVFQLDHGPRSHGVPVSLNADINRSEVYFDGDEIGEKSRPRVIDIRNMVVRGPDSQAAEDERGS